MSASHARPRRHPITADRVPGALRDLQRTWNEADAAARAQVIHAIYDTIALRGDGEFGEIKLTPSAEATALIRALP